MRRIFALTIIVMIAAAGCGKVELRTLDGLRQEVYARPDSVLSELERLRPEFVFNRNKRLRSEYHLLKAVAQDIAYPGVEAADLRSLTLTADFFEKRGPADRRMEAWYYLGKAQFNAGDYRSSIISFTRAERICDKLDAPGKRGSILRDISKTFRATGDYNEEISYLNKAAEDFDMAGMPFNSRNVRFECGVANYNAQNFVAAEEIFRSMMYEAHAAADTLLEVRCLESYAMLTLEQEEPDPGLVISLLSRVANELHSPLSSIDRGMLAYAYSLAGKRTEAITWMKRANASAENKYEASQAKFREYQVMVRDGNYKEALKALESVMEYSNTVDIARLKKSAVSAEKEYFRQENELNAMRLKSSRMTMLVIVAAALILIFAFISYFRYRDLQAEKRISEEKAEAERYMSIAEDLQAKLKAADKKQVAAKRTPAAKTDMLERLCEQYYIYEGTENLQPKVLKEVKSIIQDLRTDAKTLKGLEQTLDRNCGNLVSRLREQLPKMKDEDIRLFIFVASGFSSTTISTILEKDKSIVYNRIWRLKSKIDGSEAPDKEDFLAALGR